MRLLKQILILLFFSMTTASGLLSASDPVPADSVQSLMESGNFESAEKHCSYALNYIEENEGIDNIDYHTYLRKLSIIDYYTGDIESALKHSKSAVNIILELKGESDPLYGATISELGLIYFKRNNLKEAEKWLEKSIDILKNYTKTNKLDYAYALQSRADLYEKQKRFLKAESDYKESLKLLREIYITDHNDLSIATNNLGVFYSNIGVYSEAEKLYEESLQMHIRLYGEHDSELATSYYNLGTIYQYSGKYKDAEEFYLKALKLNDNKENPSISLLADINKSFVSLYCDLNNFDEAGKYVKSLENFIEDFKELDPVKYSSCLGSIALYYSDIKEFEKAERILNKVLEIDKLYYGSNSQELKSKYKNLAILYKAKGDYDKAQTYIEKVLNLYDKLEERIEYQYASALNDAGVINEYAGDLKKAEEYYRSSLELKQKIYGDKPNIELGNAYFNYAGFISKTNMKDADKYFHQANEVYNYTINEIMPYLTEKEQENYWFEIRRNLEVYQSYIIKNNREHLFGDLFDFSLTNKGKILSSQQKLRDISYTQPELKVKYDKLLNLKEFLAYSYKSNESIKENLASINLDSLKNVMRNLEKEILNQADNEIRSTYSNWSELNSTLKANEAIVDIIRIREFGEVQCKISGNTIPGFTNKVSYVAIVYRFGVEKPKYILIDSDNLIEDKTVADYRVLTDKIYLYLNDLQSIEDVKNELSKVYDIVWAKVDTHLNGIKTIYYSPDGAFNNININTLINSKTNKYLLNQYDIHIVSSLSDFQKGSEKISNENKFKTAVLIGNPDFEYMKNQSQGSVQDSDDSESFVKRGLNKNLTRSGIKRLPATEKEIEIISKILTDSKFKVTTLLDKDATEENLKSISNPSILHIATHGQLIEKDQIKKDLFGFNREDISSNPLLRSMLLFTGAWNSMSRPNDNVELEDGIFTAYEARNMNLTNTDLVVLSSCMSGLGDIKNGEGVYGLQRAFILAGAKHLLMSLWKVDDHVTYQLMKEFYSNYTKTNNIKNAFRHAQNSIMKTHPHFYFWGSFVLISN